MRDPSAPPATRVTAADKILDRALGRPAQQLDVTQRREALDYSLADLLRIAYGKGLDDSSTGAVVEAEPRGQARRGEVWHGSAGQGGPGRGKVIGAEHVSAKAEPIAKQPRDVSSDGQ
jgi:hypothetical protein